MGSGTFRTSSASEKTFDTADVAKLLICTSLLGLDFLCLLCVVTLLVVLTESGAVVNLYVTLPSSVQHQVCFLIESVLQKQAHLIVCINLNSRNKYHCLFSFL